MYEADSNLGQESGTLRNSVCEELFSVEDKGLEFALKLTNFFLHHLQSVVLYVISIHQSEHTFSGGRGRDLRVYEGSAGSYWELNLSDSYQWRGHD